MPLDYDPCIIRFKAPSTEFAKKIAVARCDYQGVYFDLTETIPLDYTVSPTDAQQRFHTIQA
jgi:hypothetical protein